jgi:hypothetical protein
MDSPAVVKIEQPKRQRRRIAEKRRTVELAMQPGASIARVALPTVPSTVLQNCCLGTWSQQLQLWLPSPTSHHFS